MRFPETAGFTGFNVPSGTDADVVHLPLPAREIAA